MDIIETLVEEIKNDKNIWYINGKEIRYSSNFLNNVADIFEKYGLGVTKTYLLGQRNRDQNKMAAVGLIKLIEKFSQTPEIRNHRSIGRQIIKTLIYLKPKKEERT